ncbi:unnamed protein product [Phyllotreta striolata]|uniref:Odorant receptor n=1 Tax=Phyllotreta striolata TaxID=444603 RepID=A0A9N9TPU2_PHYSR|nr:unnamed protein product [Phyllotreta striolata]
MLDYGEFFCHHIYIFKMFGLWKPDPKMKLKNLYLIYTTLCISTWILFLLSQFIYMYKNLGNVEEVVSVLFLSGPFIVNLFKMLKIYSNFESIKMLLKNLNNPLFQPNCDKHFECAEKSRKFHRNFFYLCLYLGVQTYLFFLILPFLRKEKMIPTPGWFPFDYNHSPCYEMVFIFQNIVVFWNDIICLNLDTFTSGLLMQIGMQCDFLSHSLNNLSAYRVRNGILVEQNNIAETSLCRKTFSEIVMENLVVCIQHHKKIKRTANEIEKLHKKTVFILFLGGGMIICSGLFQLSTAKLGSIQSFMLISYTACMLIEQFMYCWFGNEVIDKSSKIFNSAYNIPWIQCDMKVKRTLLQFMTLTKYPIKLKVGGMIVMSNAVFVSVVKSSYSIFTLLKKIQK